MLSKYLASFQVAWYAGTSRDFQVLAELALSIAECFACSSTIQSEEETSEPQCEVLRWESMFNILACSMPIQIGHVGSCDCWWGHVTCSILSLWLVYTHILESRMFGILGIGLLTWWWSWPSTIKHTLSGFQPLLSKAGRWFTLSLSCQGTGFCLQWQDMTTLCWSPWGKTSGPLVGMKELISISSYWLLSVTT